MKKNAHYIFLLTLTLSTLPFLSFGQKYSGLTAVASDNKTTAAMFDNNMSTRWQDSSNKDNAWFVVDLGASKTINTIKIFWEKQMLKATH